MEKLHRYLGACLALLLLGALIPTGYRDWSERRAITPVDSSVVGILVLKISSTYDDLYQVDYYAECHRFNIDPDDQKCPLRFSDRNLLKHWTEFYNKSPEFKVLSDKSSQRMLKQRQGEERETDEASKLVHLANTLYLSVLIDQLLPRLQWTVYGAHGIVFLLALAACWKRQRIGSIAFGLLIAPFVWTKRLLCMVHNKI